MLQYIRDNSRGFLAKIFMAFVIAVFALFGVESIIGTFLTSDTALRVNDVELSEAQIENAVQRRIQQEISRMSEAELATLDEAAIRRQTIDELIQRELLVQAAADQGLTVSALALDRQIASSEDFQVNGVFNNERAQAVLMSAGYTPTSYRNLLAREGLLEQLINGYTGSTFVTNAELEGLAALSGQTRDIRYLLVDAGQDPMDIEVSDEEVATFYEQNQETFIREEHVSVNYLLLDKTALAESVEVPEEDIVARYEQEIAASAAQTERRASHILLEARDAAGLEEARELASELKNRLEAGESFEDLAAEYSDDTGSSNFAGDVGYTTGDSFVEAFETALQALEVGEVSAPVQTQFGIHLIKLTELNEAEVASLDEVRDRIRSEIATEQTESRYQSLGEQLNTLAFESFDLQAPAEQLGLEIMQTDAFSQQGGSGIANEQSFINVAFSPEVLEDGLNSGLTRVDENRSVVVHLAEHQPAMVRPLEEVRPLILLRLRSDKLSQIAQERGERIQSSLAGDGDISGLFADFGLNWNRVDAMERDSQALNPQLRDWAFTLPEPSYTDDSNVHGQLLNSGTYAIVELQAVNPGSLEDLTEQELNSLQNFLAQQSATNLFAALLTKLENEADIER